MEPIDARISRLLDQLERPGLSEREAARIREQLRQLQPQP
jgi:hypothetical protein